MPVSNTSDIQAVGEKVEALLAEFASASDPAIAGRAEELVGLLVDFYGAGLARILELLDEQAAAPLLADKAVAGLLVLTICTRRAPRNASSRPSSGSGPTSVRTPATSSTSGSTTTARCDCGWRAAAMAARPPRSP